LRSTPNTQKQTLNVAASVRQDKKLTCHNRAGEPTKRTKREKGERERERDEEQKKKKKVWVMRTFRGQTPFPALVIVSTLHSLLSIHPSESEVTHEPNTNNLTHEMCDKRNKWE
jgi:hypothetical protein